MNIEQALQTEIEESKRWLNLEKDESTYKRDLVKRIELINWVLENIKNPDIQICELIESKMIEIIDIINQSKMIEIIDIINQTDSILETDKLHGELKILD